METPSFQQLRKLLKKGTKPEGQITRIAVLGESSTQFICQAIEGYGINQNLNLEVIEGDYDQIDISLIDPTSPFLTKEFDFILILPSVFKLRKAYWKNNINDSDQLITNTLDQFRSWVQSIKNHSPKTKILLANYLELPESIFGNYGNKTSKSLVYTTRKLNLELANLSQEFDNLFILDLQNIYQGTTLPSFSDERLYISASLAYNLEFIPFIAKGVCDIVHALKGRVVKCLILDLDNTLWGGIIGDDGLAQIELGDLGLGKAFCEFQSWIKKLKERGLILAVCSKNTESIAKTPFEDHPDMVLKLDDIALFVANWENKAQNIKFIQQTLNIGFDSMVFIDDNPFERDLVRSAVPGVLVPEMPEDPTLYLSYLESLNLFETGSFSKEDEQRNSKYKAEAARSSVAQSFESIDDYLVSLKMKMVIKPFNDLDKPRIAQLTQRSNQYNLRTIRYTESDIQEIIEDDNRIGLSISLEDKFGDYGLISVLVLNLKPDSIFIDTWIMSCRVLKRGVEHAALEHLISLTQKINKTKIIGEYLETPKNQLVKDHYLNLGFESSEDTTWTLDTTKSELPKHFISTIPTPIS